MDKRTNHKKSIQIFSKILLSLSLYTWGHAAQAVEHWYFPSFMQDQAVTHVQIENTSSENLDIWLNPPFVADQEPLEYTQNIPAHSTELIPIDKLKDLPVSKFFHLKSNSKNLKVNIIWSSDLEKKSQMQIPRQTVGSKYFIQATKAIHIFNVSPYEQTVQVMIPTKWTHSMQTYTVPGFGAIEVNLNPADFYEIHSEQRVMIIDPILNRIISPQPTELLYKQSLRQPLNDPNDPRKNSGKAINELENQTSSFFELSDRTNSTSYVVKLTDAMMIEQARYQIKNPNKALPRVLAARIKPTHGGVNQDLKDPYLAPWSWHVAETSGFADMGGDFCNGSPDIIEYLLAAWMASEKPICFTSFRIVKELK